MCMYICMCVCVYVCVCPLIPAASHIGITKERYMYQRILRNTGSFKIFADFPKNALFKSYGVICLPRAAPVSSAFSPRNKLLCWFETYSYVFTAQTTGAVENSAQTHETAQIYGSRILIAPPTSAYTQYKQAFNT